MQSEQRHFKGVSQQILLISMSSKKNETRNPPELKKEVHALMIRHASINCLEKDIMVQRLGITLFEMQKKKKKTPA